MNRKSIISGLVVLAVLALGIGLAVAFLYSDVENDEKGKANAVDEKCYAILRAVPSDAVMAVCLSEVSSALSGVCDALELPATFSGLHISVSLHHVGNLEALYVIDLGDTSGTGSANVDALQSHLRSRGFHTEPVDCSAYDSLKDFLSGHSIVLASASETLVRSSLRHLSKSVSIIDAPGFADACGIVRDNNVAFVSNSHAKLLLPYVLKGRNQVYASFISRLSDWIVLGISSNGKETVFSGSAVYSHGADDFMTVLASSVPAVSSVSEVLPSYTVSAFSLPVTDMDRYLEAYSGYLDSRQLLHVSAAHQKELSHKQGIAPVEMLKSIGLKEVARASFRCGEDMESLLLVKVGTDQLQLLFKGTDVKSLKDYVPEVHSWPYKSSISSVFGELFSLPDESSFTVVGDWIIVGSMKVVQEYVSGRALEYTLAEYMEDAGEPGLLSRSKAAFAAYFSFTADQRHVEDLFAPYFLKNFGDVFSGSGYCPAVLWISHDKETIKINAEVRKLELQRSKAPVFERDTIVIIPEGPFEVKNSGTGKMNRFYQNKYLSLCLSEDGKDLWGVPFKESICGTAQNIDYYANGKLQIVFGAGSRIYIIDRLGRFVSGFPLDLKKDILLGPDVYDFSGNRKYNIIVLHKDNTVEMYNLKGQKPALWKGIHPEETVKYLPEAIEVGGSTFWVVRTSMQTLIYPFYGGKPLTVFTGDQMARPDSEVNVLDATSVELTCYDGNRRTVKLK